jgi:hypothetical protein
LELVEQGYTWYELAIWAGFFRPNGWGDTSRLKRRLGLSSQWVEGQKVTAIHCTEATAIRLCIAFHIDPVDIGL